jgi:hypothetical protein
MRARVTSLLLLALACAQFATPASPFSATFRAEPERVNQALARGRPPRLADEIALMVPPARDSLRGVLLSSGVGWNFAHRVDAFAITHDSVLVLGDEELVSVELTSGAPRFRRRVGPLVMVGAAGEGDLTAVVLRTLDSRRADLLAINHRGSVLQQWETEEQLGNPAVFGPYVWVPWGRNLLSALDPFTGTEAARTRRSETIRDAYANEAGLWTGETSFQLVGGDRKHAVPPLRAFADAPEAALLDAKPRAIEERRIPFLYGALPSEKEAWSSLQNTHYAVFPRTLVALRTSDQAIRWVRAVHADVIDAAPVAGGIVTCARDGSVDRVSIAGETRPVVARGAEIAQCLVHAHAPMGAPGSAAPEPSLTGFAPVLSSDEPGVFGLQESLIAHLAVRADEDATALLLQTATHATFVARHAQALRPALARVRGKAALLAFLGRESFEPHVPIGAIALATVETSQPRDRIAEILLATGTAERELADLARALGRVALNSKAHREFFVFNRPNAKSDAMNEALIECAKVMLRLRSMSDITLLRRAVADSETSPSVRAFLAEELAKLPASMSESSGGRKRP